MDRHSWYSCGRVDRRTSNVRSSNVEVVQIHQASQPAHGKPREQRRVRDRHARTGMSQQPGHRDRGGNGDTGNRGSRVPVPGSRVGSLRRFADLGTAPTVSPARALHCQWSLVARSSANIRKRRRPRAGRRRGCVGSTRARQKAPRRHARSAGSRTSRAVLESGEPATLIARARPDRHRGERDRHTAGARGPSAPDPRSNRPWAGLHSRTPAASRWPMAARARIGTAHPTDRARPGRTHPRG